ncbi:MAG TPA: hypothetical protein VJP89_03080 [Pyrinomonadaceae bacterium]|nr:hypothetical protein [Pyrinomonadaceae bacterium]
MISTITMELWETWNAAEHSRECVVRAKRAVAKASRLQRTSHRLREKSAELKMYSHLFVRELKAHQRRWLHH